MFNDVPADLEVGPYLHQVDAASNGLPRNDDQFTDALV
jgi:hypothetical protein